MSVHALRKALRDAVLVSEGETLRLNATQLRDQVHAGPAVLYFSRLISKAAQSRLGKLVAMPIYRSMTIRNWNTTTKLLQLLEAESG